MNDYKSIPFGMGNDLRGPFELGRYRRGSVQYSAVQGTVTMTRTIDQASRFEPAYASMRTPSI